MPKRTNEFQQVIAAVQTHLDPGAVVEESVLLLDRETGAKREVDVRVSGTVGDQAIRISIECRDHARRADVSWVDEMHSKHSRLETHVLVLVSRLGFSKEAIRVAEMKGIRWVALGDVDSGSPDRLFPGRDSLWGKSWTLEVDRVLIVVDPSDAHESETVKAFPDTLLYFEDGTSVGTAAEMVQSLLCLKSLQSRLGDQLLPEHKFAEFGWNDLAVEGKRVCLRKLAPQMLRPISRFRCIAKLSAAVSEIPLKHGRYGAVRVAWGKTTLAGNEALLVATTDTDRGSKMSVRVVGDALKHES